MKPRYLIFIAIMFIAGACETTQPQAESADAARYDLKGKVISVDKASKTAEIEHEDIPGFMPPMTMTFKIEEDWVWSELNPGAEVRATLVYDKNAKDPMRLEKIGIVATGNNGMPPPETKAPEQIGKEVPAIPLVDQDGKRFTLKDLAGKTTAVTFIYRECPLPEYCIKMSSNFADAALKIANSDEQKDKLRLVSISFDPERDTPAKLREYGIGYLGNPEKPDFTVWKLAVGSEGDIRRLADFFGLKYSVDEQDKTQFNHSLVTAIIGPDGKVKEILPGNRWSAEELVMKMVSTDNGSAAK